MDDNSYGIFVAVAVCVASFLFCLFVMGFESTMIRLFIIMIVLGVAFAAGPESGGAVGGGLSLIMFVIDAAANSCKCGIASGGMCLVISITIVALCSMGDSSTPGPAHPRHERPPLKVEIVNKRRRRRKRSNNRCN